MMKFLYQKCLKPIIFLFSPELMHKVFVWIGATIARPRPLLWLLSLFYGIPKNHKKITIDGNTFQGPVLLSAGFDYNGKLAHCLHYMGFAGEEVGSVTARSCEGNEPPRLTRLIKTQSILVNKGLRNDGVEKVIKRLKAKKIPKDFVLGISIAKTNDQLSVSKEAGIEDYCYSLKRLVEEDLGHFYTVNISCPNVFGGEDFAEHTRLDELLAALKKIPHNRPMYIKMPISIDDQEFIELLKVAKKHQINGVIIGNLNKDYNAIHIESERPETYRGGLSGRPCQERSNHLIKLTRELYPSGLTIIGCGGVLSPEDAMKKLDCGADLIQMITGMIFNGPHLMREIQQAYIKRTQ